SLPTGDVIAIESKINNRIRRNDAGTGQLDRYERMVQSGEWKDLLLLVSWGNSDDTYNLRGSRVRNLLEAGKNRRMLLWEDVLKWIDTTDQLAPVKDEVLGLLSRPEIGE